MGLRLSTNLSNKLFDLLFFPQNNIRACIILALMTSKQGAPAEHAHAMAAKAHAPVSVMEVTHGQGDHNYGRTFMILNLRFDVICT